MPLFTIKILLRTGQIPKNITEEDEKHLKQRAEHVSYWLKYFAPDMIRFEVKKKIPKLKLDLEQKKFLSSIIEEFVSLKWEAENIHDAIYEASKKEKIQVKTAFKTSTSAIIHHWHRDRARQV